MHASALYLPVIAIEWDGIDHNLLTLVHLSHFPQHKRSACVGFSISQQINGSDIFISECHLNNRESSHSGTILVYCVTWRASRVQVFPFGMSRESHLIASWQLSSVGSTMQLCHCSQDLEKPTKLNLKIRNCMKLFFFLLWEQNLLDFELVQLIPNKRSKILLHFIDVRHHRSRCINQENTPLLDDRSKNAPASCKTFSAHVTAKILILDN